MSTTVQGTDGSADFRLVSYSGQLDIEALFPLLSIRTLFVSSHSLSDLYHVIPALA